MILITADTVAREIREMESAIRREIQKLSKPLPAEMVQTFEVGYWLSEKLAAIGLEREQREVICFHLGVMIQKNPTNAYELAAECWNQWNGKKPP